MAINLMAIKLIANIDVLFETAKWMNQRSALVQQLFHLLRGEAGYGKNFINDHSIL